MASRTPSSEYEPDIAARTALISSVIWVVLASCTGVVVSARLLWPDVLDVEFFSYGRLRPVHDTFVVFGWLSMAGFAAVFALVPRLAGVRLHNEILGSASVVFWTVTLFGGAATLLLGLNQGRPLGELPVGIDAILVALSVTVAYNALTTLARRRERTLYVSTWYLLAAVAAIPIVLLVGNVAVVSGVRDAITGSFYLSALDLLWLTPIGLAVAYYVVPDATGAGIFSRHLSLVGFWGLAFAGGWAGRTLALGPAPDYLESIGIAMGVVVLVPVLSAVANLAASARGLWSFLVDDMGMRFVATGLCALVVWSVLSAASSMRSVARLLGLTAWDAGVRHLAIYGVFSAFSFALIAHMYPRLVGRAWWSRSLQSFHFWATLAAVATGTVAKLAHGALDSGLRLSVVGGADLARVGGLGAFAARGWYWIELAAALVFAAAQFALAWNVYRTGRAGEPLTIAVVPAVEAAV